MTEGVGSPTFSSGLFALDLDFWDPNRTASWAEYELDLMRQPIVRFHCLAADGFGADSYSWYPSLFLRVDNVRQCLDLVVEVESEWSIEGTFPLEELHETLIDAQINEVEPEEVFRSLLGAARPRLVASPLTNADITRFDALTIMGPSVEEEVVQRGRWEQMAS